MSKQEIASPTVLMESVFLTATIEASEEREVAVVDIPNAFIQTPHQREQVLMKVKGELAAILASIQQEAYQDYITQERGVPVIYLEILKAIYGMIESPMLFYKKLRNDLEENGFKINPYDLCVTKKQKKIVKGKQLTVTWHVDDLKISHKSKDQEQV